MPKETFWRLPTQKQERIIAAAMREFADHAYQDASINRIIKAAGIPRGSFYQYFADKADLYQYIIDGLSQAKLDYIQAGDSPEAPHFYDYFMRSIESSLHWAQSDPLTFQVALRFSLDQPFEIGDQLRRDAARQYYDELAAMIRRDQAAGLLKPQADAGTVLEIMTILGLSLQRQYCRSDTVMPLDIDAAMNHYKRYLDALMLGLSVGGDGHD